ncbi:fumarate hydratase [Methanobrevibacter curvatus]|uniref:L(+)-tartrate dehydratase subunit alpha n=1 Tax=Methanobrevibacter curvatus TaxID=49547 RepID=A0A162FHG7_9EURY|nr:fumarate hydratase [Methanobrevibacter curvatus]KZX10010.1 L(+)-tartrate dehydratase subunit alpha [Methanobrevibacter curvatus]
MISQKTIEEAIYNIYKKAAIELPDDVTHSIQEGLKNEENELAILNLQAILKNIELAKEKKIPLCQDTGLPILFVKLGNVEVENLYKGIEKGVLKATEEVPLRPNIVDPITRKNTGTNTGLKIPIVDIELTDDDFIEFTILPKGFGSENNNRLKMALPGEGIDGIKEFVIETVKMAGGKPCPPIVVGVGIGATSDYALKLSKKAILSPIGIKNPDKQLEELENELLNEINKLNIGPMGLGGKTTALGVKILKADTHTAGLPIAVTIQCWAHRQATIRLK